MKNKFDISFARSLDEKDPLSKYREEFYIPQHNNVDAIYFTGNSLGAQPKNYDYYLNQALADWKLLGVEGHFGGKSSWFDYHKNLTKDVSELVGAKETEVVTMNALSVNLHLLLTSFYQPTKKKYKILCEPNLFPSDLYILRSQVELKGFSADEAIVFLPTNDDGVCLEDDIWNTIEANSDALAMIFIGGVNYYTGQVFDIKKITTIGHRYDIIVGFDLAHAVGNIYLDLHNWNVDFAAWCSYKYLNSGPGNVSSVFIHQNQINKKPFRLAGWWGHDSKNRFALQDKFEPINTAEGWQLSNAPVFGMSIYRSSIKIFNEIGMKNLIAKRIKLITYLDDAIESFNALSKINLKIITPGKPEKRGSQLSILINRDGEKVYKNLKDCGVYVDWREPDVMRIAPVPLYNSFEDIARFYHILFKCI
ncbi:MAG: kynureninase [Flavobacteriales bacterium]|nr:kynureninase [Flavobacteriales bacterium]|tara:strand:+ start:563 stop:1825 length:1263 start_codon:yes stop_codon:yes gene_type:complete